MFFEAPELTNNIQDNQVEIEVEAIDTYGVKFNDLDRHTAKEKLTLAIKGDEAPVVSITTPLTNSQVIEGQTLLVQAIAADDVGIASVSLNIKGLTGGDRTLSDVRAPYDFLFTIPYGQQGKPLSLVANVVEQKSNGPRTVSSAPIDLVVEKDVSTPVVNITRPLMGATVTEGTSLLYSVDAIDNVAVSSVNIRLYFDKNNNGNLEINELVGQSYSTVNPYSGTINLPNFVSLGIDPTVTDELNLVFEAVAKDGAGNTANQRNSLKFRVNSAPQVNDLRLLDINGLAFPNKTELTVGRNYIVNVLAQDLETGIDSLTLYRSINSSEDSDFSLVGHDELAPFHFEQSSEDLSVGDIIYSVQRQQIRMVFLLQCHKLIVL